MKFCRAYNLHCDIDLPNGIALSQKAISQISTYEGLLEGVPNQRLNDRLIRESQSRVKAGVFAHQNYIFVQPPRRSFLKEPGDMDHFKEIGRTIEWLPPVDAYANFFTIFGERHIEIVLHWFQYEFSDSPSRETIEHVANLDFKSLCFFTADDY